jgi:hypothetical protein
MSENAPITYYNYHYIDPQREPDWRYREAMKLYRRGKRDVNVDPYVKPFVFFLEVVNGPDRERARRWVGKRPHFVQLCRLRESVELCNVLEAHILARRRDLEIAGRMGLLPETVMWYERLFFHVRDRFAAKDWIAVRLRLTKLVHGFCEPHEVWGLALKRFAYAGGPLVLDDVLAEFPLHRGPQTIDEVDALLEGASRRKLAVLGIIANFLGGPSLRRVAAAITMSREQPRQASEKLASALERFLDTIEPI